jgi:methylglutaconyl-CoA hydratase
MQASGSVTDTIQSTVATVTFGGTRGNSMPGALLRALAERIEQVSARQDVHVIVLRTPGDGPFCAGASFDELDSITDARSGTEFFMGFARVILAMTRSRKTIVTRVQGKVAGGGIGIVAASDYAIALDSASIRLSELAVGIGPFVVGPAIERKVGAGAFAAMALDTEWRDAFWAERHGLFARIVASTDELDQAVEALAGRLAASNPQALEQIKATSWRDTEQWDSLLEERAAVSGSLVLSPFTREAIAAFRAR